MAGSWMARSTNSRGAGKARQEKMHKHRFRHYKLGLLEARLL